MIHRDFEPGNILIDAHGNCLLTDFGIAKLIQSTSHLTETGGILGTPLYISTEQGAVWLYYDGVPTSEPMIKVESPPTGADVSAEKDNTLGLQLKPIVQSRMEGKFSNSLGMQFICIHPGRFMMGSPSDEPGRQNRERIHLLRALLKARPR